MWILVAGKGLGEDVTNGTAGRLVGTAREGRTREETVREKGKGGGRKKLEEMSLRPSLSPELRGKAVNEPSSSRAVNNSGVDLATQVLVRCYRVITSSEGYTTQKRKKRLYFQKKKKQNNGSDRCSGMSSDYFASNLS